jgi:hypothetical protein
LAKSARALDEGLGVEDDGGAQVLVTHLGVEAAAQLALDLVLRQAEIQADGCVADTLAQVRAVPENAGTVVVGQYDVGALAVGLGIGGCGLCGLLLTDARAVGAVEDVGLSHLEVALAHQLLLHDVLHLLDVDAGPVERAHALRDGPRHVHSGVAVMTDGNERLATGHLHLVGVPRRLHVVCAG